MKNPTISVILPIWNGERYLPDAIQSILNQRYGNFELLLLCEHGTNTESLRIAESFSDPRIRIIKNSERLGLPGTLNRGIDVAKGLYIARMDSDDIALPKRFETQVAYLEAHRDVDIAASYARAIGRREGVIMRNPLSHEELRANLLFHTSVVHPTVMMRKASLDSHHLRYDGALPTTEDYEFWYRASKTLRFATIPKVLMLYRTHDSQATYKNMEQQEVIRGAICTDAFGRLGLPFSASEKKMYDSLRQYRKAETPADLIKVSDWLKKINAANEMTHVYSDSALKRVLGREWLTYSRLSAHLGRAAWRIFWRSAIRRWIKKDPRTMARLVKFYLASKTSTPL